MMKESAAETWAWLARITITCALHLFPSESSLQWRGIYSLYYDALVVYKAKKHCAYANVGYIHFISFKQNKKKPLKISHVCSGNKTP